MKMKTYRFLISSVHEGMGGHGGCVVASDKQEAYQLIIAAAKFHGQDISEEHIMRLFALSDQEVVFFEEANYYGN